MNIAQLPPKEKTWEFAYFNVFPVGPSTSPRPQIYDFDYNFYEERIMKGVGAILACCGDFGIKIFTHIWRDQPTLLFHEDHLEEEVLCVKWNHKAADVLAYGTDKGIVRVVQMDKNKDFGITHTFTIDEKGVPAQVVSMSWDATSSYLLASLSSDKVGVIHKHSKTRWSVLDPIVISDTSFVSSPLVCPTDEACPIFVLAPSYEPKLKLYSKIEEDPPAGEEKFKWQCITNWDTGVIVTAMCAFVFQNQNLIATAGANRTVDVWQINCEDDITVNETSLVRIATCTLSCSQVSYIEKMTWIRGSLGISCSDGFIYHLKFYRLPKKIKGELSYFTCKEKCKLDQNCGYTTTCLQFDPKVVKDDHEYLTTGGTHGFVYLWSLYTVPYQLAFEKRDLHREINYYSGNAAAAEGDVGSSSDNTGNVQKEEELNSIRQKIQEFLIPEYDNMEKSLSNAKESWAKALSRLKDCLEDPNSTFRQLEDLLEELDQLRKDVAIAAEKARIAWEGRSGKEASD